jgi:hypothetical protein
MTRKRAAKLLMARGCSRNCANSLMRAKPSGHSNESHYIRITLARRLRDSALAFARLSAVPAADVVPVVRCKDCKHGELYARNDGVTGVYCNCSNSIFQYANEHTFTPVRDKDDFCSYGEAE